MHPLSERLVALTPARLRPGVRLVVQTVDGAIADRLPGLAAEIAFWVLLSLPALLLSAVAVAGLVIEGAAWRETLILRVVEVSRLALTEETIQGTVRPIVEELVEAGGLAVASFAFLATVWVASRAVKVVLQTLAITHGAEEARKGWQDRLLGFGITLGAMVVGLVLMPVLVAGPNFGRQLSTWLGRDLLGIEALWPRVYFPAGILVATLVLALLYHLGIPGRTRWLRDLPGAVLATAVWLAGSAGLRWYGAWIAEGDSAYGPLAGPIVALLWLWLSGFAVLLGAELNAQVNRLWPASRRTADRFTRAGPEEEA